MKWVLLLIGALVLFGYIFLRLRKKDMAYLQKKVSETASSQLTTEFKKETDDLGERKRKFATALEKAGKTVHRG